MIACVDTHYFEPGSRTALLLFRDWTDAVAERTSVYEQQGESAEYIPGHFYLRELPCIAEVIKPCQSDIDIIVVDGYVQLDNNRDGLGKKLFDLMQQRCSVIGVAKNPFSGANQAAKLCRRGSKRPLHVTAVGIPVADAVNYIDQMHGQFRIPTLLKRVDQIARGTT